MLKGRYVNNRALILKGRYVNNIYLYKVCLFLVHPMLISCKVGWVHLFLEWGWRG